MDQDLTAYLERRFDAIDQRFERIDQYFDGIDQRFDGIDQRFDGVDQRFDGVDQRLDGFDQRLDETRQEVAALRNDTNARFEKVDQRFEKVEHLIDEKTGANRMLIEGMRGEIQMVAEGVKAARDTALQMHGETQKQLAELRATVRVTYSQVDTRVTVLEIQMNKFDQRLSSVEAEMIHGRQEGAPPPPG